MAKPSGDLLRGILGAMALGGMALGGTSAAAVPVIECLHPTLGTSSAQQCAACPDLGPGGPVYLADDPAGEALLCTVEPGCPYPLLETSLRITCENAAGAVWTREDCTIDVADLSPPEIECPPIELACGAPLPAPPPGGMTCFGPAEVQCVLDDGTPWTTAGVEAGGATGYACTARAPVTGTEATCSGSIAETVPPVELVIETPPPARLWPPDHRNVQLDLLDCIESVRLSSECGVTPIDPASLSISIVRITSSEPEDDALDGGSGLRGDGRTCEDVQFLDSTRFGLRRERAALGLGRVYTAHFDVAFPPADLQAEAACVFYVPHSRSSPAPSTAACGLCAGTGCPADCRGPACGR